MRINPKTPRAMRRAFFASTYRSFHPHPHRRSALLPTSALEKGQTLAPHRLRTNHPDDEQHRAE